VDRINESLYLETQLGTFVPEPTAAAIYAGSCLLLLPRRRWRQSKISTAGKQDKGYRNFPCSLAFLIF